MCFYCVSAFESGLVATLGCTFRKLESESESRFFRVMFWIQASQQSVSFLGVGSSSVRQEETTSLAINWFERDLAKYLLKDSVHMIGIVRRDFDEW